MLSRAATAGTSYRPLPNTFSPNPAQLCRTHPSTASRSAPPPRGCRTAPGGPGTGSLQVGWQRQLEGLGREHLFSHHGAKCRQRLPAWGIVDCPQPPTLKVRARHNSSGKPPWAPCCLSACLNLQCGGLQAQHRPRSRACMEGNGRRQAAGGRRRSKGLQQGACAGGRRPSCTPSIRKAISA